MFGTETIPSLRRDSATGEVSLSIINDFPVSDERRSPFYERLEPSVGPRLYARNMLKARESPRKLRSSFPLHANAAKV